MPDVVDEPFRDVHALIERSHPRPRVGWLGYAAGLVLLVALAGAYVSATSPGLAGTADLISKAGFVGIMVGLALVTSTVVRRQRNEFKRVEALEEMVQLRKWPQAAELAQTLLLRPMRSPQTRAQTLILLASILARYGRFADAITVQTHLLETIHFDPGTDHGLRVGRAMAMLREDHLVDADRAMSELRRTTSGRGSAGLALVQLYRDVKTGHPAEAIEHFQSALDLFRQQLGQRVADAYALSARAYDLLGRSDDARQACEKATVLAPAVELSRRYPEVSALWSKYPPSSAPAGLAAGVA